MILEINMAKTNQKHTNNIAILGGTFDPIHNGHLKIANLVIELLKFDQIIFIPNNTQPHRKPAIATAEQRLSMLKLALDSDNLNNQDKDKFIIDICELTRQGPTYTIDTIYNINPPYNTDNPNIWLILGLDAFYNLPDWHNFDKLLKLCNFIVINRKTNISNLNNKIWAENYLKNNSITPEYLLADSDNLTNTNIYGSVISLDAELIDISASEIRQLIHKILVNNLMSTQEIKNTLRNLTKNLIPNQVLEYILEQNLYN